MNWSIFTYLFSFTLNLINGYKNNTYKLENSNRQMYEISNEHNIECCTNTIKPTHLWWNYYNCLSQQSEKTVSGQMSNLVLVAYVGSVTRLPCHLCVSPTETMQVIWMYAQSIKNLSFNVLDEKETTVINKELTLYYTNQEDAGVYRCQLGKNYGNLMLLEVTDEEKYSVIKPLSSNGPYPLPPVKLNNGMIVFTYWGIWSECSSCDKVGRRRRYGLCYIALINTEISNTTAKQNRTSNELVNDETLQLFLAYPKGIPCRSKVLPPHIGHLPEVQSRDSEIMIGLCKVPCKNEVFKIRSDTGEILEQANNTAGIYSLCQHKPLQPPHIARETMFVLPGAKIHIRCPGTILRDVPVTWRIGNKVVVPRQLDATTAGRVHLNARDHIVFTNLEYTDANIYSCWQDDILAGVVKLEISKSFELTYRNRFILVAIILVLVWLLRLTSHILRYRLRKY